MADLKDLLKSKKVKAFVRKEKSRPWTVLSPDSPDDTPTIEPVKTEKKKRNFQPTCNVDLSISSSIHDQLGDVFRISNTSVANREQRGSKEVAGSVANREQRGSKEVAEKHRQNSKGVAQRVAGSVANREQRGSKEVAENDLFYVVGHEQKILRFLFEECFKEGALVSKPFSKDFLATFLETSYGTAKSVILRLEKKGFLNRHSAKTGRGGWIRFEISKSVYQVLLISSSNHHSVANGDQKGSKEVAQRVAQRVASPLSSSSSYLDLNKTTTTENVEVKKISDATTDPAWNQIDLDPLKEIGFNHAHVVQVQKQGLHTPQTLQDSIYALKFDLNANSIASKIEGSPLNFFMGILRKGPYAPPPNYESPEDRQLREYLEAKEKLLENRRERLNHLKEIEFEEWVDSLSKSEKESLAPMGSTDVLKRSQLRNHFDENIWEEKKREIVERLRGKENREVARNPLLVPEKSSYTQGSIPPLNPP